MTEPQPERRYDEEMLNALRDIAIPNVIDGILEESRFRTSQMFAIIKQKTRADIQHGEHWLARMKHEKQDDLIPMQVTHLHELHDVLEISTQVIGDMQKEGEMTSARIMMEGMNKRLRAKNSESATRVMEECARIIAGMAARIVMSDAQRFAAVVVKNERKKYRDTVLNRFTRILENMAGIGIDANSPEGQN